MQNLTPTLLAEKIKQLLNGGVELEDIQKMALSQGVDPVLFSEALDMIQGKVTESMETETEAVESKIKMKPVLILCGGVFGVIVLIFMAYIFWSKSQNQEPIKPVVKEVVSEVVVPVPEKRVEVDENANQALDFINEFEAEPAILAADFYETLAEDFNLSDVTIIEDSSNRGSQLVSEDLEEERLDDLVVDIEVGRYEISGLPRTVKPGVPYDFEVRVYDTDDKLMESYDQEIEFRSTARNITIEPTYKFKPSDKGVAKRTVTFNILGKHTLAVNAKGNSRNRAQVSVRIRQ